MQQCVDKPLKVATIFSFAANEEQNSIGNIEDETFEVSAMNSSSKEFLGKVIDDYNIMFKTNFTLEADSNDKCNSVNLVIWFDFQKKPTNQELHLWEIILT